EIGGAGDVAAGIDARIDADLEDAHPGIGKMLDEPVGGDEGIGNLACHDGIPFYAIGVSMFTEKAACRAAGIAIDIAPYVGAPYIGSAGCRSSKRLPSRCKIACGRGGVAETAARESAGERMFDYRGG